MKLDMRPTRFMNNMEYSPLRDIEFSSYVTLLYSILVKFSYFKNSTFFIFGNRRLLTLERIKSVPSFCIPGIFNDCAKIKMFWIYANSIVARMEDPQSSEDWSIVNFIRQSVHIVYRSITGHLPITIFHFCASPNPTRACFINSRPKSSFNWLGMTFLRII